MKIHTTKTKASIALAAIRGEKISKLSGDYSIHPNVITKWKNIVEDGIETFAAAESLRRGFCRFYPETRFI